MLIPRMISETTRDIKMGLFAAWLVRALVAPVENWFPSPNWKWRSVKYVTVSQRMGNFSNFWIRQTRVLIAKNVKGSSVNFDVHSLNFYNGFKCGEINLDIMEGANVDTLYGNKFSSYDHYLVRYGQSMIRFQLKCDLAEVYRCRAVG